MADRPERQLDIEALGDVYDAQGVDRSPIRQMLSLAPEQRLRHIEAIVEDVMQIRELNGTRPLR
jgi:hypothetical protein